MKVERHWLCAMGHSEGGSVKMWECILYRCKLNLVTASETLHRYRVTFRHGWIRGMMAMGSGPPLVLPVIHFMVRNSAFRTVRMQERGVFTFNCQNFPPRGDVVYFLKVIQIPQPLLSWVRLLCLFLTIKHLQPPSHYWWQCSTSSSHGTRTVLDHLGQIVILRMQGALTSTTLNTFGSYLAARWEISLFNY